MAFTLFLDGDGKPQFDDKGLPLFIQEGATEPAGIDVNAMIDDNRAKKTAADAARKERDEIAAKMKGFDGLDPEAARKALDVAKAAEEGKLLDAGKLEELKAKYAGEAAQKVSSLEKALEDAKKSGESALSERDGMIHTLLVENAFTGSSFLREKTNLLPEFAYATFKQNFSVEYQDGKPVVSAKDNAGNPLFSAANPSAYASPEEAIKMLVESHPQRDKLLKPVAPNGGSGGMPGGVKPAPGAPKTSRDIIAEGLRAGALNKQ